MQQTTKTNCPILHFPHKIIVFSLILIFSSILQAKPLDVDVPSLWKPLEPIITARLTQTKPKMKLSEKNVTDLIIYLHKNHHLPALVKLQNSLPKTTLEILRSVSEREVPIEEAEKMATYLQNLIYKFDFQNLKQFDENTSHIIGREWQEIDYTGENLTWQKQRKFYKPHGIDNFKTEEALKNFFRIESRMPYFRKIYRPKNSM